jgi:hypothetical protein
MPWWGWMLLGGGVAVFLLWLALVTTKTYH